MSPSSMARADAIRPRVFVDADVLFAGSASPTEYGASLVVLRMAEITLIEAYTCRQVITEVTRNLSAKLPDAVRTFELLAERCLKVLPDPSPAERARYHGLADDKDLSVLVAALQAECPWLVTFNLRHFRPGHPDVEVVTPGVFVQRVRHLLARLN